MANDLIKITAGSYTDYVLPCPSEYQVNSSTLVDSGRNGSGVVVGTIIRNSVRSIEITWNFLDKDTFAGIARLFDTATYDNKHGSFYVSATFFDPTANTTITKTMYPSDRITNTAHIKLVNGEPVGYEQVKLTLVEV